MQTAQIQPPALKMDPWELSTESWISLNSAMKGPQNKNNSKHSYEALMPEAFMVAETIPSCLSKTIEVYHQGKLSLEIMIIVSTIIA